MILLGDTNCDLTSKQAEQPIDNSSKHMLELYELFSFKQLIEADFNNLFHYRSCCYNMCQKHCGIRGA